jgi:hypothetical protein
MLLLWICHGLVRVLRLVNQFCETCVLSRVYGCPASTVGLLCSVLALLYLHFVGQQLLCGYDAVGARTHGTHGLCWHVWLGA